MVRFNSARWRNALTKMTICFMHCNFVRIHQTLRIMAAMAWHSRALGLIGAIWMMNVQEDWEASQVAA